MRAVLSDSIFYILFFRKGAAGAERREQEEHDDVRRSVSHQCSFLLHIYLLRSIFCHAKRCLRMRFGDADVFSSFGNTGLLRGCGFVSVVFAINTLCHHHLGLDILDCLNSIFCLPCENKETLDACASEKDTELRHVYMILIVKHFTQ